MLNWQSGVQICSRALPPGAAVTCGLSVVAALDSAGTDECIARADAQDRERFLRGAFERDDGQMTPPAEITDLEVEPDSRLTADQSLRGRARSATWPSRSRFKARRLGCWTLK